MYECVWESELRKLTLHTPEDLKNRIYSGVSRVVHWRCIWFALATKPWQSLCFYIYVTLLNILRFTLLHNHVHAYAEDTQDVMNVAIWSYENLRCATNIIYISRSVLYANSARSCLSISSNANFLTSKEPLNKVRKFPFYVYEFTLRKIYCCFTSLLSYV